MQMQIVFVVFTPSLMFASLAKTVTLQDIISWFVSPLQTSWVFFESDQPIHLLVGVVSLDWSCFFFVECPGGLCRWTLGSRSWSGGSSGGCWWSCWNRSRISKALWLLPVLPVGLPRLSPFVVPFEIQCSFDVSAESDMNCVDSGLVCVCRESGESLADSCPSNLQREWQPLWEQRRLQHCWAILRLLLHGGTVTTSCTLLPHFRFHLTKPFKRNEMKKKMNFGSQPNNEIVFIIKLRES